jgi:putative exosortase-associated protein (TIGR04073 family)
MRKTFSFLAVIAVAGILVTGCANTERKLGRGLCNTFELFRLGEYQRSVEQTGLFGGSDEVYPTGVVTGINRTLARTGIGLYEIVTCPLPPYGPVCTDYLTPGPVFPDSFKPLLPENQAFATDANLGFSGGEVARWVPGARFRIFDSN